MSRKYIAIVLTIVAMLTASCTKENLEDCNSGLGLHFTFTHNTNNRELFGEQVNRVRVYFFDEQGVLQLYALDNGHTLEYSFMEKGTIKSVSTPNVYGNLPDDYLMRLNVPEGKYRVLSWAGSATQNEPTFLHGCVTDPATGSFEEGVEIGKTRIEELRMFLKHKTSEVSPEVIEPVVDQIDDLWYGAIGTRDPETDDYTYQTIDVRSDVQSSHTIELIRNSNILQVTVTGIDNLPTGSSLQKSGIWLTAVNDRYCYQNTIDQNSPVIRYAPYSITNSDQTLTAKIKFLRMDLEKHLAKPILLNVHTTDGKSLLVDPIDVVKTLNQARDAASGKYIYDSQSDFDKIYEHPIEIRIIGRDLQVKVFVGEWEIVNVVPES